MAPILPVLAFIFAGALIREGVKKIISKLSLDTGPLPDHIEGGVEVPVAMYPHVATIIVDKSIMCGGSIISDKHILTSGHCTVNEENVPYKPDAYNVYLGSGSPLEAAAYEVCKIWTHEAFVPQKNHYDIAVVMLCKDIKFGPNIHAIQIAPDDSWKKEKHFLTITSFAFLASSRDFSHDLIADRVRFLDSDTCNETYASDSVTLPDHMFCMLGDKWTNVCFGDSGSGVIWRKYLVGLVSVPHESCVNNELPSLYTDVTYFQPWIVSKINEANSMQENGNSQSDKEGSRMLRNLLRKMQVDLVQ